MKCWLVSILVGVSASMTALAAGAVEVVEIDEPTAVVAPPTRLPSSADCSTVVARQKIEVSVRPPEGSELSTVVFDIDYPEKQVALPGSRNNPSVSERLSGAPGIATIAMNDKDDSVRVVVTASAALPTSKRLFALEFDVCQGAAAPTAADYACTIGGCVAMTAPIEGCVCSLEILPPPSVPAAKP